MYGRRQVPFHRSGRYGLLRKRDLLGKGCIALGRRDRKLAEAAEREVLLERFDRYLHVGVGGTLPGAHLVPCRSARWGDRPGIGGIDREFHLGTRFCGVVAELQRIVRQPFDGDLCPGSLRDGNLLDLCAFRLDDDMARAVFASRVPAYFHLGGDVGQPRGLYGCHTVRERCTVVGARYRRRVCVAAAYGGDRQPVAVGLRRPGLVDAHRAGQRAAFGDHHLVGIEEARIGGIDDLLVERGYECLRSRGFGVLVLGARHGDVVQVEAALHFALAAEGDAGFVRSAVDDQRVARPLPDVLHFDQRGGFHQVADRAGAFDRDVHVVVAVVHRAACRRIGGCVELHEQRRGLAGVNARERGDRDGAHVGGLTQLDMAFVTGIYRGRVGVALGRYGLFHSVGREGELVAVRAVDRYARPAVLGVGAHPVVGNPLEVVAEEDVSLGMRVLGHVGRLNQLDDLFGGVLAEFGVAGRDRDLRLAAFVGGVGLGRDGDLGRRAGLAALGGDRQPGLVLHRERPVVGCFDGEDHRIRIFGFEGQQAFFEPRYHDAGRQVGVLRKRDALLRQAGMEVVAAVGADGEFAVARLALVQGRGDGDLDILARLALVRGDDEPACGLGDLPGRVDAHGKCMRGQCRIEELQPCIGQVFGGECRGDGVPRIPFGVVVAARRGSQERDA